MNTINQPLSPADPATVFISYAREDRETVEQLEKALHLRGVRVLRDIPNLNLGANTAEAVRAMIDNRCDAIVFYASEHLLRSDFIWRHEVPAALARRRRQGGFHLISVLPHSVSFSTLAAACSDRGLTSLADFNDVALSGSMPTQEEIRSVGRRAATSAFLLRCARGSGEQAIEVCFRTFAYSPPTQVLHLDLDWSVPFAGDGTAPDDWTTALLPALTDTADMLAQHGPVATIDAWVKARLPAAVALGHAFPRKGACHLRLVHEGGHWTSDGPIGTNTLQLVENRPGTGPSAVVEVSISRNVVQAVTDWCKQQAFIPAWRLHYEPDSGASRTSLSDEVQARTWAYQVGEDVRRLWDRERVTDLHLFISSPSEFAVMLGQQLRDKRRVQVYAHGVDGCHLVCIL